MPFDLLSRMHRLASADPVGFGDELIRLFSQPVLSSAILISSPSLYQALCQVEAGQAGITARQKLLDTLYKYLVRLTTRATPYGLFAGTATGTLSDKTGIVFDRRCPIKTSVNLDGFVLSTLSDWVLSDPVILNQVSYRPNSSLTFLEGGYRYTERRTTLDGPAHILAQIGREREIDQVFSHNVNTLEGFGEQDETMRAYAEAMLKAQLLTSGLEENITGPDYLHVLVGALSGLKGVGAKLSFLRSVTAMLEDMALPGKLERLRKKLLETFPQLDNRPFVRVDLGFPTSGCSISRKSVQVLLNEFKQLGCVLFQKQEASELTRFVHDFAARYGTQQVPLLEALDCESGIGYGAQRQGTSDELPLIDGLDFPIKTKDPAPVTPLAKLKDRLIERAYRHGDAVVLISARDLDGLTDSGLPGPDWEGMAWLGTFLAASPQAIDQGDFRFLLRDITGPSGFELLGRFCGADAVLMDHVREAARNQERIDDGAVYAEIAHHPGPKAANILRRPHLRDHEIAYLCASSMPDETQISLSDLLISVSNGQVVLISRKLGKRIVPRMATAHNHSVGLPVYRFLCDLGCQGHRFGWDWGQARDKLFLPRVAYGHWILARATWNLSRSEFPDLFAAGEGFEREWQDVCGQLGIPRLLLVTEGDNELLIDNHHHVSWQMLRKIIKKSEKVRLTEFLTGKDEEATGFLGGYVNQVVIPFDMAPSPRAVTSVTVGLPVPGPKRDFPPGSEWLYLKIYCGTFTADQLLIGPLAQYLGSTAIEKWFFVRYHDPDHHIRLRVLGQNQDYWQTLSTLNRIMEGKIGKIQVETYSRELERYRGLPYESTESIFQADSEAVLQMLSLAGQVADARWKCALCGADRLLDDLGLDPGQKKDLVEACFRGLFAEFGGTTGLKVQLDRMYRERRKIVSSLLERGRGGPVRFHSRLSAILAGRSEKNNYVFSGERALIDQSTAASFVHMFFNRLFLSRARQQELVIYHHLVKYYTGLYGRRGGVLL